MTEIEYHRLKTKTGKRLSDARLTITVNYPFFGYLLAGLDYTPVDVPGLTIATNGFKVAYSPMFLDQLSNNELLFVICHEVLHCALEHISRRKGRQQLIWNIAVDIVTNEILMYNISKKRFSGKAPANAVRGKQFLPPNFYKVDGLLNKSAEEIYRELMLRTKTIKINLETGESPNFDQHHEPGGGEQRKDNLKKEGGTGGVLTEVFRDSNQKTDWRAKLTQAAVFARNRGKLPLGIEEEYQIAVKGYFPWQRLLAQYVQRTLAYDAT
ncbi:MAG: hypothetical protein ACFFBD_14220, partial [Candidatus Hodarchaeota archaeon]